MLEVVVEKIDDTVLQGKKLRLRSRHFPEVQVKVDMEYMIDGLKKVMVNALL